MRRSVKPTAWVFNGLESKNSHHTFSITQPGRCYEAFTWDYLKRIGRAALALHWEVEDVVGKNGSTWRVFWRISLKSNDWRQLTQIKKIEDEATVTAVQGMLNSRSQQSLMDWDVEAPLKLTEVLDKALRKEVELPIQRAKSTAENSLCIVAAKEKWTTEC